MNLFHKLMLIMLMVMLTGCQVNPTQDQEGDRPEETIVTQPSPQPTSQSQPTLATGVFVYLAVSDTVLGVGDTLEIRVEINRVENMMGAEVHGHLAPYYLELEDAEPDTEGVQMAHGDFLRPDFIAVNSSDGQSGKIAYAIAQMPPSVAVSGNGVLFTARVKAKTVGESELTITSVLLADAQGQQIPAVVVNDTVIITVE